MINLFYKKGLSFTNKITSRSFVRKNFNINIERPIISFTFDDFPKSAVENGLEILDYYGLKATFYISFGLINKETITGKISDLSDIQRIINSGHSIGCHTFNHCGAFEQNKSDYEKSIRQNQKFLQLNFPGKSFSVFSYPKGQVKLETKKVVQKYFICSRGIIPGINDGNIDLNLLKATRLYGDIDNFDWSKKFIDQNLNKNGWLIFYTHGIDHELPRYGCTPALFEETLKYSIKTGSNILSVEDACSLLKIPKL